MGDRNTTQFLPQAWRSGSSASGLTTILVISTENSLPGVARTVLGTLLAEASDTLQRRDYHALRLLCGAAPVTRRSGKSCVVVRRRSRLARHGRCRSSLSGRPIQATPIFPTRPTSGLAFHPAGLVFSERGHPPTVSVSILRIGRRPWRRLNSPTDIFRQPRRRLLKRPAVWGAGRLSSGCGASRKRP